LQLALWGDPVDLGGGEEEGRLEGLTVGLVTTDAGDHVAQRPLVMDFPVQVVRGRRQDHRVIVTERDAQSDSVGGTIDPRSTGGVDTTVAPQLSRRFSLEERHPTRI